LRSISAPPSPWQLATGRSSDAPACAADLVRALARAAADWAYPRHCYHCGEPIPGGGHLLCDSCWRQLNAIRISGALCSRCGAPLAGDPTPGTLCLRCLAGERHFDRARAIFAYAEPAQSLIWHFKFRGNFFVGTRLLDQAMAEGWIPEGIQGAELVLPVPLHWRRRWERGYDQALLLARKTAKWLDARLVTDVLVRRRYTSQQARLSASKRRENVRGAFAVRRPQAVEGRSVLLVDDVLTTGATVEECARTLRKAYVREVTVLTLARAGA